VTNAGATACPTTGLNPPAPAGATCRTFNYRAKNAQGTPSNTAIATIVFLPASGLVVTLRDAKYPSAPAITDYRWIIEEDRTFWADPRCQINTGSAQRPLDSYGRPCPALPVESLGYNFHTAHMDVVAQGCVGTVSCEAGQTVQGSAATCDIGNGVCRVDSTAGQKAPLDPKDVYLDPSKHYFVSVLPGDAINPTIGAAGGPQQVDPSCTSNCAWRSSTSRRNAAPTSGRPARGSPEARLRSAATAWAARRSRRSSRGRRSTPTSPSPSRRRRCRPLRSRCSCSRTTTR
jgi:hypothetical protein